MENVVTMSLGRYDALQHRIAELERRLEAKTAELESLQPFEFEKKYDGSLSLKLTNDARRFLDKAFDEYKNEYELRPLEKLTIWTAATNANKD